jgi:molecular chaperone DnaK
MTRTTIDYGIDLGTTNSSIALLKGGEVEVIENNERSECTPSAVWLDKGNQLFVGRRAKERLEDDPENSACEFKLRMGTGEEWLFPRSGRRFRPEDLSAEILKSLKADVKQRTGEDIGAAVITVPAAFELPQCEATRKAAEMAGLMVAPLVQEPVAVALAYGFQSEKDNALWMVYDFGNGTFDAAVIQIHEGMIEIVNHGGDNQLGTKLIGWEIVERLLAPAFAREHKLDGFRRSNPKWSGAMAKLKWHAEQAEITLSREPVAPISIDFLCVDNAGEKIGFYYELRREDVANLAEPYILRSINICRRVLAEKRLGAGDIEKVLLVGGPTLTPVLRETLADRAAGLGIPLAFDCDPLTVVVRGAAIFAGTQRLPHKSAGSETMPLAGGRTFGTAADDFGRSSIEFRERRNRFYGGKMTRTTIDYGIDLGTTNSSIALLKGAEVEIIKNNEGSEYTPSAVWLDKGNRTIVGRRAKERLEDDPENSACEFKLRMGTGEEWLFPRSGRRFRPEELSAEVLKSLKADVKQRTGEDIGAAVITVPAAFELPQCEATRKACEMAGLTVAPLVQEPVAAALAYSFRTEKDKVFWLAYDFGGGTFDAAVIQIREGMIEIVNHGGDNQLGGKLIDWEIVERLLAPAVAKQRKLDDFRRGNPKWRGAMAKLKWHAEQAKIILSREPIAPITIDFLCVDKTGEKVDFDYELRREDVANLAEPYILRSINICRRVLAEKRLGAGDIEKVLLVGGPTLMPVLRETLADRAAGLGIPLAFDYDPLTVVARGAAIFAGTQRLQLAPGPVQAGHYRLDLEYKSVGSDTEPLVGGRITGTPGEDFGRFTIEFINADARPQWRSGKVGAAPDGTFMTTLWAEKGRQNVFLVELQDAAGNKRETTPDRLAYVVSVEPPRDPPLIHSVGVGRANNEMAWMFEKGAPLPLRRRGIFKSAVGIQRGQSGQMLRIPVLEGQNRRANRNQIIGTLTIPADKIAWDVPAGQDIEVTIEIDRSRILRSMAYVPMLKQEFEHVVDYAEYRKKDPARLDKEIAEQKKRLEKVRAQAAGAGDVRAQAALQRIDAERMVAEVEQAVAAGRVDPDAADNAGNRLLDLAIAIDAVEDALEWPTMVAGAHKEIEVERKIVQNPVFEATSEEKASFAALEQDIHQAEHLRDPDLLSRKVSEMDRLGYLIVMRQTGWWVQRLNHLEGKKSQMSSQSQAETYLSQARRAIANSDVEGLKAAVRQLASLLPASDEARSKIMSDVL